MRNVVAALVLLNLAFFAWAQWLDRPAAGAAPAVAAPPRPVARLILASEAGGGAGGPAQPAAAGSPATASSAPPAAPPGPACSSYGPIDDSARAGRLADALRARGLAPRQRSAEGEVPDGWRVLVGGLATPADVDRAIRALAAGAVADATPLENATDDRRIAVGLFRARDRAERRAAEVRRLGLVPVLVERMRTGTAYWVDVTPPAGGAALPPAESLLAETPPGYTIRIAPCPAGGNGR